MSEIIEVYHAGVQVIRHPDILHSRPQLDFGPGFYLTDIYDQAVNWALRRADRFQKEPVVNKYLLHISELKKACGDRCRIFKEYDEDWIDFVIGNRLGQDLWKNFDYIEGGVADDRVVDTIDLYTTGFISRTEAIDRLKYLRPNNQICISNQTILDNYLTFTNSINVKNI